MPRKSVKLDPKLAEAAQAVIAETYGEAAASADGKVGCAYGLCAGRFREHSVGRWDHSGCPFGSRILRAAQMAHKSGTDMTDEEITAAGRDLLAKLQAKLS